MLDQMQFTGAWREYQARALSEMQAHLGDERLHIVAAPGAGKTVLGLEAVRRIGRPALIFAPTIAIREQWVQRLCPLFLGSPPDPGSISRDLTAPRTLTLSSYQSLSSIQRGEGLERLIKTLNAIGPLTVVLDEAHHLRREWWKCLIALADSLDDVRMVALTATPPYDASAAEFARYQALCGPIDLEIGIPELVRNGDLCPHQDHLILSEPTQEALTLLDRRRDAIAALYDALRSDDALLDWLAAHPWLTQPDAHIENILQAPEMLSAALVHLASAGRKLPRAPLKLLGVSARHIPPPSLFWLERLLDGIVFRHAAAFPLEAKRMKALRAALHSHGLIEGKRVRLRHTRSAFKLMASSLAKLDSITDILAAEIDAMGGDLRMVILSDHIRAGELPTSPAAPFKPAKLGVVPIFETLRRSGDAGSYLGVLTGSLVIIPKNALAKIGDVAAELQLDPEVVTTSDLPGLPDHSEIRCKTGGTAVLVRIVTALFERGHLRIIVGTQSLLGEGWDAPTLNSLVLASNTASFMMSNQMRGRAIRIDPARPDKVANIWHLATIDPEDDEGWDRAISALNWGFLNDSGDVGLTDIAVVARRFRAFEGIANDASRLIEGGMARLGIDPAQPVHMANARTYAIASDRTGTAERWAASLGDGAVHARVRETAAARYAPRALSWFDTLQALTWTAAGSGAFGAANALRSYSSLETVGWTAMGVAGAATLASLPRLARAGRLAWRNGSLEGSLSCVARALLQALADTGTIVASEMDDAHLEIRTSIDGRKDIVVTGVSRATERCFMEAMAEILRPVENPRYVLVRTSWLGLKKRTDYHAVPAALGARKKHAARFAELWQSAVGSSSLVFTRTAAGRLVLLRARAASFAAGFQRTVDRRSVWL